VTQQAASPLDIRRASIAIFLLAMSVLMLEVALTRIFSAMSWHHFAYLIISLAFLGFGAASSFLTISPRFATEGLNEKLLGKYSLAFCLASVLGFAAATKVRFYPMDAYYFNDYSNAFSLLMLYMIVGMQFFFAGVCIGYLISNAGEAINRIYFADLVGAGIGTLLSIAGINYLGAEATIYAAASASGLVSVMYLAKGSRWPLKAGAVAALILCVLMSLVARSHQIFPVYFPPEKVFRSALQPHYYRWHVVSRIDVMEPVRFLPNFGGALSRSVEHEIPAIRAIMQDGTAPTGIMNVPGGDLQRLPLLGDFLQGAPYVIKKNPEQSLVIGVGGGIDVLIALYNGSKHVVGVEVNPVTVDAIKNRYADFAGRIFNRPDVELVTAEGRHYLTATDKRFDVIQLSGVDTYSALALGAYALAENYLYTTESMHSYWEHLTENGILSFSRWLFTPPRETLRLVAIQLEALQQMGIRRPDLHFMLIAGQSDQEFWVETLLKKTPFTETEATAYRTWADRLQFQILYDPYNWQDNIFNSTIRASNLERALIIDEYPYNIRPINDDNPFFFQFYRWRSLWHPMASKGGYFIERFPLGLAVLFVSLVQIFLLAAAFIIAPLLPQGAQLRRIKHKVRVLVYFGALGLGFIMVEIALLQKYTVFVGGPIYSMAITLFAILVFSGLGSLLSQRFNPSGRHSLTLIIAILVVGISAESIFADYALPQLMFLPHGARCLVTIAALAPLAIMMGMPFPMGLRVTQRLGKIIVPWAWGVNAVTTTLGSILCVLASMTWGFTASLLAAGVIYLIGLVALRPVVRSLP